MGKPKRERSLSDSEAQAVARNLRVSPRKLNLVAGLIRGKPVDTALADLEFSRKRIAQDVKKCVMSAVANAENNENLRRFLSDRYGHVQREFARALAARLPRLDKETLYWRLDFLGGALTYAMADFGLIKRPAGVGEAAHRRQAARELIRFAAAGFEA